MAKSVRLNPLLHGEVGKVTLFGMAKSVRLNSLWYGEAGEVKPSLTRQSQEVKLSKARQSR